MEPTTGMSIDRAKSWLVFNAAFFASIMLQLRLVEDKSAFTAWTDTVTLGYNPKFVDSLTPSELNSMLCHEVMHVALLHSFRRHGRNMGTWNDACDYVINGILKREGYTIPSNWLHDKQYYGMSEEAVYALLMKRAQENSSPRGVPGQQGDGGEGEKQNRQEDEDDSGNGEEEDGDDGDNGEEEDGDDGDNGEEEDGDDDDGRQPDGPGSPAPDWSKIDGLGVGEVRDYVPQAGDGGGATQVSETGYEMTAKEQEQMWKLKIQQAAIVAKMQGRLPQDMDRMLNNLMEPIIPWREILARFITESAANDYNWKMPNPRYMAMDLYLPSLRNPTLGTIAVMIDTSGSIEQTELDRFASELQAILASYPETTIEVIYADSKVAATQTVDVYELELHPKGGGGTDYRPAFRYLEEQGITPVCSIYFTDGWCWSFPSDPPDFPVLWLINGSKEFDPPFGELTRMEEQENT